jgi:glycerol-1-phosphate dehydrogenase [NAD(P)+]
VSTEQITVDDLSELRELIRTSPEASSLREIGLREIVSGPGAIATLPQILLRLGIDASARITVFSDLTPKRYHDADVLDVVLDLVVRSNNKIEHVCIAREKEGAIVLADELTVASAIDAVTRTSPQALVSVGSGTVVDIGKVIANELSLTHVVVQTAASVNGFADDQSVLLISGVKRTTPSRWPDALIVDPDVVAHAPLPMTRSGLGDQLSMFSASADWYLSDAVGFDTSFSPTLVTMMRRDLDQLVKVSSDLGRGDPEAVGVLASCLTRGGIAMGVAGRTAPSSGTEHLISHLLEMHADAFHVPSASHGSQVGVASVVAAIIWQRVRERLLSGDAEVSAENVASRMDVLSAFAHLDPSGALAEECWAAYERKSTWTHLHLDDIRRIVSEWSTNDEKVDGLLKPAAFVTSMLKDARAPVSFSQLDPAPGPEVVQWALTKGHLMRDRFCVMDLAVLIGAWNADDVTAVLSELDKLAS